MRHRVSAGAATALIVALAVVLAGGSALGYFSTSGAGSASATVASLGKPTITAATPAVGGTVALTWSAVTAPGAGTVTYYVSRDGGGSGSGCPSAESASTVTSCTNTGVPVGTHTYTVTARWQTLAATSSTSSAKITIGAATHFTIAAATTTPAVGASDNLTITAKDEAESTVTNYTGSHNLVFSGASSSPGGTAPSVVNSSGSAINFGSNTALTFTTGVASVTSSKNGVLKIYRAGAASLVATEGAVTTTSPLALTVTPGAATKYTLAAETATPTTGAADNLTITAQDTYGNTATSYTGSHNLVFSGAATGPAGNLATVDDSTGSAVAFGTATAINFSSGVAEATGSANGEMRIYKSGTASVKATEGSITNATALALTVAPGAAVKLVLTSSTLVPVAATSFNLTLTAQDTYANTATAYAGSKNIVFSGSGASPGGNLPTVVNSAGTVVNFGAATALTFTLGVAAVSSSKNGLARLYKAGAASITASDGTLTTPAALEVTVSAAAAARWALIAPIASAGTLSTTCFFTCTATSLGNSGTIKANVAVVDASGNTVSAVGTGHGVKITSTGGTITGTPIAIPSTGPAVTATQFTYTAPVSGAFTNTITVAASEGTAYTAATITASK